MVNLNKSIAEIRDISVRSPEFESSLVRKVNELENKPLKDFTTEDLRVVIGQKFWLEYLIPVALSRLSIDPLIGGDYWKGDLLQNVVETLDDVDFWKGHPSELVLLEEVISKLTSLDLEAYETIDIERASLEKTRAEIVELYHQRIIQYKE